MAASPIFELRAVGVRLGAAEVLRRVTAELGEGRCTVIVGPSGAGKSTLLRLLDRLQEPTSGQVRYHGRPLTTYDVLELRRRVGLVQQTPVLLGETVREDLATARPDLTDAEAELLLDRVGLPGALLGRETASLSGGEGQRVCVARALSVDPEVLLLDEPTSSLDGFSAAAVERIVRGLVEQGLTAVMVTHDLAQARRVADDVIVVLGGTIVDAADPRARAFLQGKTA